MKISIIYDNTTSSLVIESSGELWMNMSVEPYDFGLYEDDDDDVCLPREVSKQLALMLLGRAVR